MCQKYYMIMRKITFPESSYKMKKAKKEKIVNEIRIFSM